MVGVGSREEDKKENAPRLRCVSISTGISPMAKISTPCAWRASSPIFGREMRTHIPPPLGAVWVLEGLTKKKTHRVCGAFLSPREFRLWRRSPRPAPGEQALRSSGGRCEPISRPTLGAVWVREGLTKKEQASLS